MANPWEEYAPQNTKNPWEEYATPTKEAPKAKSALEQAKEALTPPSLSEIKEGFLGSIDQVNNYAERNPGWLLSKLLPEKSKQEKDKLEEERKKAIDRASKSVVGSILPQVFTAPAQPFVAYDTASKEILSRGGTEEEARNAGLVSGGLNAASNFLPVLGKTVGKSIGIGALSGLGTTIADPALQKKVVSENQAKQIPDASIGSMIQSSLAGGATGAVAHIAANRGAVKAIPKESDLPTPTQETPTPKVPPSTKLVSGPELEQSALRVEKAQARLDRAKSDARKQQYQRELVEATDAHNLLLEEKGMTRVQDFTPEEALALQEQRIAKERADAEANMPESLRKPEGEMVDPQLMEPGIPKDLIARGFEEVPLAKDDTPPPVAPDLTLEPMEPKPTGPDLSESIPFEKTEGQVQPELPMDMWQGKEADFADLNRPMQDNPLLGPRNETVVPQERGMGQGELFLDSQSARYTRNPDLFDESLNIPKQAFDSVTNAFEALNVVKSNTQDANINNLINQFLGHPNLKDIGFKVHDEGTVHTEPSLTDTIGQGHLGVARLLTKSADIHLNAKGARGEVVTHEVLHALTMAALKRNPQVVSQLRTLGQGVLESVSRMAMATGEGTQMSNAAAFWKQVLHDTRTGKIDADEVLAYGLTSPVFRAVLTTLDANGKPLRDSAATRARNAGDLQRPKQLTAWDKFVDLISSLFGSKPRQEAFKAALSAYHRAQQEFVNPKTAIDELTAQLSILLNDSSKNGVGGAQWANKAQSAKGQVKQPMDPIRREIELGKNPDLTNPKVVESLASEPDIDATPFRNSMTNMGHRAQQLHVKGNLVPEVTFRKLAANIEDANSFVRRHIGQRTISENSRGLKQKRNPDSVFAKLDNLSTTELGKLINDMTDARRNGTNMKPSQGRVLDAYTKLTEVMRVGVDEYNKTAKQYGYPEIGVDNNFLPSSSNRQYIVHVMDSNGNRINTNFDGHTPAEINAMLPSIKQLMRDKGLGEVKTKIVERNKYQLDNSLEQFHNLSPAGTATKLGKEYTGAYNVYDLPAKYSGARLEENINNYSQALARGIATLKTRGEMQPLIDMLEKQGKTNLSTLIDANIAHASELGTKMNDLDKSVIKTITALTGNTVGDSTIRQLPRHMATVFQLSKVIPNIMQPLQAAWQVAATSPMVAAGITKAKLGIDGAPLNGYAHMSGAIWDLVSNAPNTKELSKLMYDVGLLDQNSHRADFEDVGVAGKVWDKSMDFVSNIVSKPDQFAKLSTALMYDRLLSKAIPNKTQRHRMVLEEVRRAAPDMDRWNRAPATFKFGMFSPVVSSLSNFWSHFYSQAISSVQLASRKEKRELGPILAIMLGVPLMAGIKASPLAPLMDAVSGIMNVTDLEGDDQQEPFSDQVGRALENATGLSQYGLAGETGYDLGKAITAPSPMMVPGAPAVWGTQVAKDALSAATSSNPNAVPKLAQQVAPPLVSNMLREQQQGERQSPEEMSLTTNKSTGKDFRNQSMLSALGVPTVKNQRSASMLQEQRRRDKADQAIVKKFTNNITARIQRGMPVAEPILANLKNENISEAVKIQMLDSLPTTIENAVISGKLTAQQERLIRTELAPFLNTIDVQQERGVQQ